MNEAWLLISSSLIFIAAALGYWSRNIFRPKHKWASQALAIGILASVSVENAFNWNGVDNATGVALLGIIKLALALAAAILLVKAILAKNVAPYSTLGLVSLMTLSAILTIALGITGYGDIFLFRYPVGKLEHRYEWDNQKNSVYLPDGSWQVVKISNGKALIHTIFPGMQIELTELSISDTKQKAFCDKYKEIVESDRNVSKFTYIGDGDKISRYSYERAGPGGKSQHAFGRFMFSKDTVDEIDVSYSVGVTSEFGKRTFERYYDLVVPAIINSAQ